MSRPKYLLAGNLTIDVTGRRSTTGGAVWFGAHVADFLAVPAAAVSAHRGAEPPGWPSSVELHTVARPSTMIFRNSETAAGRIQRLSNVPKPFEFAEIPEAVLGAEIIHIAPMYNEIDGNDLPRLDGRRTAVSIQGWLRQVGRFGRIEAARWRPGDGQLDHVRALFCSEEDIRHDPVALQRYVDRVPVVIVSSGGRGAALYREGQESKILPPELLTLHRDGAGDVLASAFCCFVLRGRNVIESAREAVALATRFVADGLPALARPTQALVR